EPAGLHGHSAREIVAKLQSYGLQAQSFHVGLELLQNSWEELGNVLPECGATDLVMPFADANSLPEVRELAETLQAIAVKLRGLGLGLHYHNHSHEIAKVFEGKCFMDWLLDLAPDLRWQVDVGWVTAGGADVPALLHQWRERISMLHIKDIFAVDGAGPVETRNEGGVEVVISAAAQKGGQPDRMGDGIVDFAGIFAAAQDLGISTFILENDNPENVADFVDSGMALVEKYNR
ncbi:MAG: hypothetical protein AAF975_06425, partial [Spirochaetota bacterium]